MNLTVQILRGGGSGGTRFKGEWKGGGWEGNPILSLPRERVSLEEGDRERGLLQFTGGLLTPLGAQRANKTD